MTHRANNTLTASRASRLLTYNAETGELYWRPRVADDFETTDGRALTLWNSRQTFRRAGKKNKRGYRSIDVDGVSYQEHRVAWLLHYGEWPAQFIDHINGVRDDNRMSNLREASYAENNRNQRLSRANTSGVIGVSRCRNRWIAQISINGKPTHLGSFTSIEEAAEARSNAEREYGFHPNHGRAA